MRILFLGAAKRVSLLERFARAADKEDIQLDMWSVESSKDVPISRLAHIECGPKFDSRAFPDYLVHLCRTNGIDIVVPNMDTATVALADAKLALSELNITAVVSSRERCAAMLDKRDASHWFKAIGAPTPESTPLHSNDYYPRIFKSRKGFGSRDQRVVHDVEERTQFLRQHSELSYFEQPYITGIEYSVDAYVDKGGNLLQAMTRHRVAVVDGEVDVSRSVRHEKILQYTRMILARGEWYGPITLQFVDPTPNTVWFHSGPQLIEINPRFGGGVIHSIELGLDMPRWIIQEHLNRPVGPIPQWKAGSTMTRYRTEVFL